MSHNIFDKHTIALNRNGNLTYAQSVTLFFNYVVWNAVQFVLGLGAIYIAISSWQREQNPMLSVLFSLLAFAFMVHSLRGWRAYLQDRAGKVQRASGIVQVSTTMISKTSGRGILSLGKRYYLHIDTFDGKRLSFQVDHRIHKVITFAKECPSLTLFYLPATKELLSFEAILNA